MLEDVTGVKASVWGAFLFSFTSTLQKGSPNILRESSMYAALIALRSPMSGEANRILDICDIGKPPLTHKSLITFIHLMKRHVDLLSSDNYLSKFEMYLDQVDQLRTNYNYRDNSRRKKITETYVAVILIDKKYTFQKKEIYISMYFHI